MRRDTIKRQLIRLADAMMRGGKKRVKCEGKLFDLLEIQKQDNDGNWFSRWKLGGSCALGAAYEGVFGTPPVIVDADGYSARINGGDEHMQDRLEKKLPVLQVMVSDIDEDEGSGDSVAGAIINLNDSQGEPRWKIARWLRRLAAKI